jgi:coenzyme PQQ precursor peptide PqqA
MADFAWTPVVPEATAVRALSAQLSKRGIKARLAESTRRVPHQRDPQTRIRNDTMAWSTPEVREVCVGMEVTSYLSAEM